MDVVQTADAQYQREPADDLEPLSHGGQHVLRGRMRIILLTREHQAGDERDQERELSSQENHFTSLKRSKNTCGHCASNIIPIVARIVPMPSTPRMRALPMSCPRSVPTCTGSLER